MNKLYKLVLCLVVFSSVACRSTPYTEPNCQNASDPSCAPAVTNLNAPTNIAAETTAHDKVKLTWTKPSYSKEFSVVLEKKSENDADYSIVETFSDSTESYEVTGLDQVTTYTFRLQAISGDEESDYSNEATAITQQMPINPTFPIPTVISSIYAAGIINIGKTFTNTANMFFISTMQYERKHETASSWSAFTPVSYGQYTLDNAPLAGPIVFRLRVTYSDGTVYISAPSNATTVRLETPTNMTVQQVTIVNNIIKHQIDWEYGISPAVHTGFEVSSYFSSGTGVTVSVAGAATRSLLYFPTPCPTGDIVSYWVRAKSTNALILPSNVTPTVTIACP